METRTVKCVGCGDKVQRSSRVKRPRCFVCKTKLAKINAKRWRKRNEKIMHKRELVVKKQFLSRKFK